MQPFFFVLFEQVASHSLLDFAGRGFYIHSLQGTRSRSKFELLVLGKMGTRKKCHSIFSQITSSKEILFSAASLWCFYFLKMKVRLMLAKLVLGHLCESSVDSLPPNLGCEGIVCSL